MSSDFKRKMKNLKTCCHFEVPLVNISSCGIETFGKLLGLTKIECMKKNDNMIEPLTVDVKTAARMLGVCEKTVRTLTKKGELPVVRILGRVLYRPEDLTEFVEQRTQRAFGSVDNGAPS